MFLSGAKSQNFFATAILVSAAIFCWSAEAAPKQRQIARSNGKQRTDVGAPGFRESQREIQARGCARSAVQMHQEGLKRGHGRSPVAGHGSVRSLLD